MCFIAYGFGSPPTVNFIKSQNQPAIITDNVWTIFITIVHIDLSVEWTVYGRHYVTCDETTSTIPPIDFPLFSKANTLPALIHGSNGNLADGVQCAHIIEE